MTVLRAGCASDVGRVRAVNEDRFVSNMVLFAVADGMGGHAGGDVAAGLAATSIETEFSRHPSIQGLIDAIVAANARVWERAGSDLDLRGMGTTVVAAALVGTASGDRIILGNVGDSRAYRFRLGDLIQLTADHSVAEEMVMTGELSEAEAAVHPHRHILTRALGIGPTVEVDAWQIVPAEGDRYLLCSDGMSNELSVDRIEGALAAHGDPQQAADALVRLANDHGGHDNVTVVVVDVVVGQSVESVEGSDSQIIALTPTAVRVDELQAQAEAKKTEAQSSDLDTEDAHGDAGDASPSGINLVPPQDTSPIDTDTSAPDKVDGSSRLTLGSTSAAEEDQPGIPVPRTLEPYSDSRADGRLDPLAESGRRRSRAGAANHSPAHPVPTVPTRRFKGPRIITFRAVLFVILLGALIYGAIWTTRYLFDSSWYVQAKANQLVIFQGQENGFLWYHPKAVETSPVTLDEVPPTETAALQAGVTQPSKSAAEAFLVRLKDEETTDQQLNAPPPAPSTTVAKTSAAASPSNVSTRYGAATTLAGQKD